MERRRRGPAGWGRRLYAALHRWAEAGWAGPATGLWCFLHGFLVPGPADALLVPLGVADPGRIPTLAAWAFAGSTLGGIVAYAIGALAFDSLGAPLLHLIGVEPSTLLDQRALFGRHGAWIVLGSAMSPLPTKVVCLAAGSFGVPAAPFVAALTAGRFIRFAVVAVVLRSAAPWAARWAERRAGS